MSIHTLTTPAKYYHVRIVSSGGSRFFRTNTERALVISVLQKHLGARSLLAFPFHIPGLAQCVDLLAYSLTEQGIELVLFSITKDSVDTLIAWILAELDDFRAEYSGASQYGASKISVRTLRGVHHALELTCHLHLRHFDWENDRYSSIGFYLHDRRGDWMRLWRIARLYDNDPAQYYAFIAAKAKNSLLIERDSLARG